jgi:hypothetical protein
VKKSSQSGQRNTARQAPEPHVGIFWLCDGKLLIDSTPLPEAEDYGDFKTHPRSHLEAWTVFRQRGIVPIDTEYEEHPRGRVIYDTKTCQFTMLADRCILKKRELVEKIKSELGLPKDTKIGPDSHYRCFACLRERHAE